MPTSQQAQDWTGQRLVGDGDAKLGSIDQVFVDNATDQPTFAVVKTGLLRNKTALVPVGAADARDGKVYVSYTKDQVKKSPSIADPDTLSVSDAQRLFSHYGLDRAGREPARTR